MAPSSADDAAPDYGAIYRLPEHARIARLLSKARTGFLLESRCWFGGGTAIVMANGEYRVSLDVDFLCSSQDGYRALRQAINAKGSAGIFKEPIRQLRDFRSDQYGLRVALEFEGQAVKFEIVREGRIDVTGAVDGRLGCPVLSLEDQFAEKMMANSNRGKDPSVCYRDALDLGMLVLGNGGRVPDKAWEKAQAAYGGDIRRDARWVVEHLKEHPAELERAAGTLRMKPGLARDAIAALARACERDGPPPPGVGGQEPRHTPGSPSVESPASSGSTLRAAPTKHEPTVRSRRSGPERRRSRSTAACRTHGTERAAWLKAMATQELSFGSEQNRRDALPLNARTARSCRSSRTRTTRKTRAGTVLVAHTSSSPSAARSTEGSTMAP